MEAVDWEASYRYHHSWAGEWAGMGEGATTILKMGHGPQSWGWTWVTKVGGEHLKSRLPPIFSQGDTKLAEGGTGGEGTREAGQTHSSTAGREHGWGGGGRGVCVCGNNTPVFRLEQQDKLEIHKRFPTRKTMQAQGAWGKARGQG